MRQINDSKSLPRPAEEVTEEDLTWTDEQLKEDLIDLYAKYAGSLTKSGKRHAAALDFAISALSGKPEQHAQSVQKPTSEQIERIVEILVPFVQGYSLPLNPEQLAAMAYAILTYSDSTLEGAKLEAAVRGVIVKEIASYSGKSELSVSKSLDERFVNSYPADHYPETARNPLATKIIEPWRTVCANCGDETLSEAIVHDTVYGYQGGKEGCGIHFQFQTSAYLDIATSLQQESDYIDYSEVLAAQAERQPSKS